MQYYCIRFGPGLLPPTDVRHYVLGTVAPRIYLVAFGPDMSFEDACIFVTSNVPKSSQGSAGSLLLTMQNLSSTIEIRALLLLGAK